MEPTGGATISQRVSSYPSNATDLDDSSPTLPLPSTTPTPTSKSAFPTTSNFSWYSLVPASHDLLPSFLHHDTSKRKFRPTAWLDGLRGLAAFLVLIFHFTYRITNTNLAWGADDRPEMHVLWRLPIVRLLSSGSAMVSLFFLISGYALSLKPLQLIRSAQKGRGEGKKTPTSEFTHHIASAIVRRPIRLFAPVFLSTLLIFVAVRLGIWDLTRPFAENKHIYPIQPQENHVETKPNILAQLWHVYTELSELVHNALWENFFGGNFDYDQHMWTIPVELRSSFLLFGSLVPCVFMTAKARLWYWAGLVAWAVDGGNWQMCLFWTGAGVAEWNLATSNMEENSARADTESSSGSSPPETPLLVMLSLLILSYPEELADKTPLYRYLSYVSPPWFGQDFRFWQCLGGGILFATISTSPALKKPLETGVIQYLGRISYGLYLMHGPVIHTVGFGVMGILHGESEEAIGPIEYLVCLSLTAGVAVWAGDLWWMAVDLRAVKWARSVSEGILVP